MVMKLSISKSLIAFIGVGLLSVATFGLCGVDQVESSYLRTDSQKCTLPGYCYGYEYNYTTGEYEYSYGYHSSCDGTQNRISWVYLCKTSSGSTYAEEENGSWGSCIQ